ncbi:hypothetical protein [Vibrio harveyi]|uniref:hypothetical protein n=1 Tax=Vibrio harveyi TaxID=669 RepID=UPI003CE7F758
MKLKYPEEKSIGFRVYKFARIYTELLELEKKETSPTHLNDAMSAIRDNIATLKAQSSSGLSDLIDQQLKDLLEATHSIERSGKSFFENESTERNAKIKFYRDALSATAEQCLNYNVKTHNKGFVVDLSDCNVVESTRVKNALSRLMEKYDDGRELFSFGEGSKPSLISVTFPGCFKPSERAFSIIRELAENFPKVSCYSEPSDESLLLEDSFNLSECALRNETYWKALDENGKSVSQGIYRDAMVRFEPSYQISDLQSDFVDSDADLTYQLLLSTDFLDQKHDVYEEAYKRWEQSAINNKEVNWAHVNSAI